MSDVIVGERASLAPLSSSVTIHHARGDSRIHLVGGTTRTRSPAPAFVAFALVIAAIAAWRA